MARIYEEVMPGAGDIKFAISLEDHVSPHAKLAGAALTTLQGDLKTSKTALAQYQRQLTQAKALGDVEGYRKYAKLVAEARRETFLLGDALVHSQSGAKSLGAHLGEVGRTLGHVAGEAVKVGAALATMFAGIAVGAVKMALSVNAANERIVATFEALGDAPGAGKKTLAFLNQLSGELPQSRDQLASWAKEFQAFGVTDLGALRGQIRATAAAQAIMGEEGAEAYKTLAEKIQDAARGHHALKMGRDVLKDIGRSGVNAATVAGKLGMSLQQMDQQLKGGTIDAARFGRAMQDTLSENGKEPLAAMGNELETLWTKAKEALGHMFDGIDTAPITDAIKAFIMLGDQGQDTGADIHAGVKGGVQAAVTAIGAMITNLEVGFLTVELWVIQNRKDISDMWEAAKVGGGVFLTVLGAVGTALGWIASAAIKVGEAIGWIGDKLGMVDHGAKPLTPEEFDRRKGILTEGGAVGDSGKAPIGHATGGMVHRPPAGEFFAAVAPGEMILPQRDARNLMGGGIGAGAAGMMAAANTNARSSGGVQIEHLEITIQAPHGVTDATSLSVTGLALALERYQLATGR